MPSLAARSDSLQRTIFSLPLLIALTLLPGVTASAKKVEPAASSGPAVFTGSSAAGLTGTKRVAITSVLERQRMVVSFAENGRMAIEALKASPNVDVVLLDVMMPEMV